MTDIEAQINDEVEPPLPSKGLFEHDKEGRHVPWRERIKHFSWQWEALVNGTAVTSTCLHIFPYHNDSQALKIVATVVFLIGLVMFVFNTVCKVAKVVMYPKDAWLHLTDPSKNAFSGFWAVGNASLLDAAANISADWHMGSNRYLWFLYGLWWANSVLAYFITFGVIYTILGQKSKNLEQIMAIWVVPCLAMIATSTCGGILANLLAPHFPNLALITTGYTLTMGLIALSISTMITFGFLLRLFLHGAPDGMIVLGTFNTLTPLGQGGFSLLVNGANLAKLMPNHTGDTFPQSPISGQLLYALCFGSAYIMWCMGLVWIIISTMSIVRRLRRIPRFWVSHWCLVFPNGTFALLSVQLGNVLQSRFYHGFGAAWCIIVFVMWSTTMIRSIPAFIEGSMFVPPPPRSARKRVRQEKKDKLAGSSRSITPTS